MRRKAKESEGNPLIFVFGKGKCLSSFESTELGRPSGKLKAYFSLLSRCCIALLYPDIEAVTLNVKETVVRPRMASGKW